MLSSVIRNFFVCLVGNSETFGTALKSQFLRCDYTTCLCGLELFQLYKEESRTTKESGEFENLKFKMRYPQTIVF
jgi:hypothetical protein